MARSRFPLLFDSSVGYGPRKPSDAAARRSLLEPVFGGENLFRASMQVVFGRPKQLFFAGENPNARSYPSQPTIRIASEHQSLAQEAELQLQPACSGLKCLVRLGWGRGQIAPKLGSASRVAPTPLPDRSTCDSLYYCCSLFRPLSTHLRHTLAEPIFLRSAPTYARYARTMQ